jgi:hypothetical protein
MKFPLDKISALQSELNTHILLTGGIINSIDDLRVFMEHHVFAVWDFMSLIKSLQNHLCPSTDCWLPSYRSRRINKCARLVNDIILAEETDYDLDGKNVISHFDLYCEAMKEVGADLNPITNWINRISTSGTCNQLFSGFIYGSFGFQIRANSSIPAASAMFMENTFEYIKTRKPHIVAAAFAFGRENIIPDMFREFLKQLNFTEIDCPRFHYYLARHIEIDGDEHGPASLSLVEDICENNPNFINEAEKTGIHAIKSRIRLWDNLAHLIQTKNSTQRAS